MHFIDSLDSLDACIFDLDGTLLDSMHIWQDIDRSYVARFGIDFDNCHSEKIKKMTNQESAQYFIDTFHIPKTKQEIIQDWNDMVAIEYHENIALKEGVKHILEVLKQHHIKMCIATSCNKEHAIAALERLEIMHYFDFIKTCKEVGKGKEYPDIYLSCCEVMQVNPKRVMVFEDLYGALKVVQRAGFQTCGVYDVLSAHESDKIASICDYFIYSFKELLKD